MDIVDELLEISRNDSSDPIDKAISEITRLRAENESLCGSLEEWKLDLNSLRDENAKLRADQDECDALRSKLTDILTRTANALKGEPGELQSHSWHDLPEWAQRARDESATLQAEMERAAIACSHHEAQMARGILIAAMQKGGVMKTEFRKVYITDDGQEFD